MFLRKIGSYLLVYTRHQNPEKHCQFHHRNKLKFLLRADQQEIVWINFLYMKPVSCNSFPLRMTRLRVIENRQAFVNTVMNIGVT
jgi:hypothetical protein